MFACIVFDFTVYPSTPVGHVFAVAKLSVVDAAVTMVTELAVIVVSVVSVVYVGVVCVVAVEVVAVADIVVPVRVVAVVVEVEHLSSSLK